MEYSAYTCIYLKQNYNNNIIMITTPLIVKKQISSATCLEAEAEHALRILIKLHYSANEKTLSASSK